MLTLEPYVFSQIAAYLRERFDGIRVVSHEFRQSPTFPVVVIEETSNTILYSAMTDDFKDHYVNLVYTINIYSDLPEGEGKRQMREIAAAIDEWMSAHGLTRHTYTDMYNYQVNITRMVLKYACVYSDEGIVYKPVR